jgi:SOS-response transcriptional repressor LexA
VSTTDAIRRPWTDYEAALNDAAPTDRQRQVFRLIYESARDRGYQPTLRELQAALGLASLNGLVGHLVALDRKGWLVYRQGQGGARCLTLLRKPNGEPFAGFCDRED